MLPLCGVDVNVGSGMLVAESPRFAIGQIEPPDECPVFDLAVAERTVAEPPTSVLIPVALMTDGSAGTGPLV